MLSNAMRGGTHSAVGMTIPSFHVCVLNKHWLHHDSHIDNVQYVGSAITLNIHTGRHKTCLYLLLVLQSTSALV